MALPALPLVIFCFTIFFVILSVLNEDKEIRIPFVGWTYTVRFFKPPLIGVLFLLILSPTAGSLEGIDLWKGGFAGDGKVFPYHTMVQFETLAFVCIALDMTGILAYIALKAIQAAGSSGRKLFFYFFFLSSAFTICTSNDIVILTLTPIIYYCTKVAKISPYPMLFSEFFTANICSMTLVIGNPVNLIVANANNLSFAGYSNFMAAPAIVGSMTCCVIMYLLNRKDIDVTFTPPELNPDACLKDKRGVAYHGSVLFLTRVFLGVSDNLHAEGWIICTVAAGFSFLYNLYFWPWDIPTPAKKDGPEEVELMVIENRREPSTPVKTPKDADAKEKESFVDTPSKLAVDGEVSTPVGDVETRVEIVSPAINTEEQAFVAEKRESGDAVKLKVATPTAEQEGEQNGVSTEMPTSKKCILNCPWAVLPFVYGMFTLVSGLKKAGWIDAFAHEILNAIPSDEGNSSHAIITATYLMATISFVLCCLLDNQPASILLTQVLISPVFSTLPTYVRTAGMLGVLEGANVGGCWSLMGALAGIMWATLLRNKGVHIGYIQFMKVALRVMPIVTFMIAFIIFLECTGKAHQ